ncbi:helix-turn-helix transcriptional regulator [Spongiactinospora sp. TRM90649]|nr:helix-turn-helix transcriptional regulator [Spongiactinospora sp. TRM90649]MDF5759309.1 helix-turn-helix transcriptional regulator [Spongiactinospora sp. TRM90649]
MPRRPDPLTPTQSPWHLLGAAIRHWRGDRTQRELGDAVHVDNSVISEYERGTVHPSADTVRLIDEVTGAGGHLIALHAFAVEFDVLRAGIRRGRPPHTEDDEMERRATVRLLAALSAGAALPLDSLELLRSGLNRALGQADDLDELEAAAYELAYAIRVLPPREFIAKAAPRLADVQYVARHRRDLEQAGLQRVTGQMSALLAIALHELGDPSAARRWWRTARKAADASGDLGLRVWVRGRHAFTESCALRPVDAASLIAEAEALAAGKMSAGLMEARIARSMVEIGSGDAGHDPDLLAKFDEDASRLPDAVAGERAAIWGWSQERHVWERAATCVLIGDPEVYDELTHQARRETNPRAQGILQMRKSMCLVRMGEVEQAVEETARVYGGLPAQHRTTAVRLWADRIVSALPQQAEGLPAVRELRALVAS